MPGRIIEHLRSVCLPPWSWLQAGDGSNPWLKELRGSFHLRNKAPASKRRTKPAPR